MALTHEQRLQIISKAWGRTQTGYCFFPWISGSATDKSERIKSYREGPAFLWPKDKAKILTHIAAHENDDLYWCPSLFETPRRSLEQAMDEHALWADLDTVDPRTITDYEPTVAWETSPGKYQALWLLSHGDIQGASWPGQENQRLTYYVEADPSGWDTTQLLRLPDWVNHKPEYRDANGQSPRGKLLWANRRTYLCDDFTDLPEVSGAGQITDVLEGEVDRVDRHEVWARVRLDVSKHVRELLAAKSAGVGDRSDVLWQIERELADAGCSVTEIVAIARASVWNKFAGRADELKRLTIEASKAISLIPAKVKQAIEEEWEDKPDVTNLMDQLASITPPRWLVKDLFAEGCCGFIAGQPKFHKSWIALDLAFSVAMGARFLDHFAILNPGPVLYIQSEDAPPTVKQRVEKILPSKQQLEIMRDEQGKICMGPPIHKGGRVNVDGYIGSEFTISDEGWQAWLEETMDKGQYRMVIMDPFMMMAGNVNENLSQDMTEKVFRPLKQLSRKYKTAIILVHHMKKAEAGAGMRGGLRLLGSVAGHAWAEDSLYVNSKSGGRLHVEHETKHGVAQSFKLSGVLCSLSWQPVVSKTEDSDHDEPANYRITGNGSSENGRNGHTRRSGTNSRSSGTVLRSPVYHALKFFGGTATAKQLADHLNISRTSTHNQLNRLKTKNLASSLDGQWTLQETP